MKVLTTCSEQIDSLASLLRDAFQPVALCHLDTGEIVPDQRDAELLLAGYDTEGDRALAKKLLSQVRNLSLDMAVILLQTQPDQDRIAEGLRIGAADVVAFGADQHLLHVIRRCRREREQRRQCEFWRARHAVSERRCERLMDSSRDAIALISDGIHIYVNDAYARMLEQTPDDLLFAPLVDFLEPDVQAEIKPLLSPLSATEPLPAERRAIRFRRGGSQVNVEVQISQVDFQGEPALQWCVPDTAVGSAATAAHAALDEPRAANPEVTEAQQVNLRRMTDLVTRAMQEAVDTQRPWLLYYVRVDEFDRLQGDAGLHAAEQAMVAAWRFLRRHLGPELPLGRIRDNAFLFLTSHHTPADARQMAENLCRQLDQETVDLGAQSVNLHFSVGIAAIDNDHEQAANWIDRCLKAVRALDTEGSAGVSTPVRLFEDLYPTSLASLNEENNIKQFVRQMLEQRMLGLSFQPIVALREQAYEDYEVFTRQTIAELPAGIPQDLFKRAFRTPVAGDLDRWAILEAFRVLRARLEPHPRTRLFIKISAPSLRDPGFPDWLRMSFQAARLDPRNVIFQVEEKDVSLAINATRALAEQLAALKVGFGLTHYGLSNPPGRIFSDVKFEFAKPDQSLVLRATTSTEGVDQLSGCITAAKEAGVSVIVPFVEDASIIPLLWKLGVDHIQGYYIQSPGEHLDYEFSLAG
ncbi:MAG: EAL domain-containing protein [Pseudomonadota bacterium]